MPWIAVAGSVIGGLINSNSASQASDAQSQSTAAAVAEQRRQYDQTRADTAPYRDTGSAAVRRIADLLGLSVPATADTRGGAPTRDQFTHPATGGGSGLPAGYVPTGSGGEYSAADLQMANQNQGGTPASFDQAGYDKALADFNAGAPGPAAQSPDSGALNKKFTLQDFWDDPVTQASYQFGLDEGTKAIDRMAGARGGRNSGATLKALTRFGTDYTGQQAGNSYNRFYSDQDRTFNRLSGVAGTGQTATTNTAQLGQTTANTVGNLISSEGNARGAAAIAGGNAISGGIGNAVNSYTQQQTLNRLLGNGGASMYGGYSEPAGWSTGP